MHIRLVRDLHCAKQIAEIRSAIDRAVETQRGAVVLELGFRGHRPDLLLELAGLLASTRERLVDAEGGRIQRPVRVYVVLESGPGEAPVGGGAAALALIADDAMIRPGVRIAASKGQDLPEPPAMVRVSTNAEREAEAAVSASRARVQSLLASACARRGLGVELSDVLPRPARAAWWVSPDPWQSSVSSVVFELPASEAEFAWGVLAGPAGADEQALSVSIDARTVERLGLARAGSGSITQFLTSAGVNASGVERVDVRADLTSARAEVRAALERIDRDLRDVRADLRESTRSRRTEDQWKRRRAGERTIKRLPAIEEMIEQAERALTDYPELLVETPPGATPVGQTPDRLPAEWRRILQAHRDSAADVKAQARALAAGTTN